MLVYLSYVDVYKFLSCAVAMQNRFSLALEMDFNFVFCCYEFCYFKFSTVYFFLSPDTFQRQCISLCLPVICGFILLL